MEENRPNECGVCHEDFDSTVRCPRIFSCLHTLCTECIEKLIKTQSKLCPFCRQHFSATEASKIRVNQTMLELLKVLSHQKSNMDDIEECQHSAQGKTFQQIRTEIVRSISQVRCQCEEEQQDLEQVMQKIEELYSNIRKDNDLIENDLLPIIHRLIADNTNMMEKLNLTRKELLVKSEELKVRDRQLEGVEVELGATSSFKEAGSIMDRSEDTSNSTREWIETSKVVITDAESELKVLKQESRLIEQKITRMLEAHKIDSGKTIFSRHGLLVVVLTLVLMSFPILVSFYAAKENIFKSDDLAHAGHSPKEIDPFDMLLRVENNEYAEFLSPEHDASAGGAIDVTLIPVRVDTTGLPAGENGMVDQIMEEESTEDGESDSLKVGSEECGTMLDIEEEGSTVIPNDDPNKLVDSTSEPIASEQDETAEYLLIVCIMMIFLGVVVAFIWKYMKLTMKSHIVGGKRRKSPRKLTSSPKEHQK